MPIVFHCDHCGKKIEAQDNVGGQWRNCPSCHNRIYVPSITEDNEDLPKLAPIDEPEEERTRRLMAEAYQLTQAILRERETPTGGGAATPTVRMSDEQLTKTVIKYLRQMADGKLTEAGQLEQIILPFGRRTIEVLDKLSVSEMPEAELAKIPQRVLAGLIRNLRARVS